MTNKNQVSLYFLGTICCAIISTISSPTLAQSDNSLNTETNKVNLLKNNFSTSAKDFFVGYTIAENPLELDKFCRNYPYNSQCENYQIREPIKSTPIKKPETRSTNDEKDRKTRFGIAPEVSTLGLGGSIAGRVTPELNARIGINAFGLETDYEDTDATYEADLNLFNVSTLLDYYPFKKSGFHLSAGLVFGDNNLEGTATPNDSNEIEIGDETFTSDQLEEVELDVSINDDIAPYVGIGWGNPVAKNKSFGFWGNLGVVFGGSPEVAVTPKFGSTAQNNSQLQQTINEAADRELDEIEDDLEDFNIYPVISLGVYYHF